MGDFTVGGVIRRTFALLGRHFGDFAVAAALLVFLPRLAGSASGTVRTFDAAGRLRDATTQVDLIGPGSSVLAWLGGLVLYGIVVRAALVDLRGERFGLGAALGASLRALLPNLGITLLSYVAVAVGMVLLVVPGLMLQCAWLVVVPASMLEGTGVFGAFGRSRALTAGRRWRIFGLLLVYGLAIAVVGTVALVGATAAVRADGGVALWTARIAGAILSAAVTLAGSAGATACYLELRRAESGVLGADVVEAFS